TLGKAFGDLDKQLEELNRIPGWYMCGSAVEAFFRGLALMIAGIGVLKRSNLGRLLTLIVAAYYVVAVIAEVALSLGLNIFSMQTAMCSGVVALVAIAFAGFAYIVLLNPRNAAEFRTS